MPEASPSARAAAPARSSSGSMPGAWGPPSETERPEPAGRVRMRTRSARSMVVSTVSTSW